MIALPPPFVCAAPVIVDGDTLACDGQRIRLARVDAPELHGCPRTRHCAPGNGPGSKAALIRIIGGRAVRCTPVPWRDGARSVYDRWGRVVARCSAGGVDVGEAMVRGGFAVRWPHGR